MAKNICPNCLQVTISFGDEREIKCPICEAVFPAENVDDKTDKR